MIPYPFPDFSADLQRSFQRQAALLGGLDPVTPVRAPPVKCSRSVEMRERRGACAVDLSICVFFGGKIDQQTNKTIGGFSGNTLVQSGIFRNTTKKIHKDWVRNGNCGFLGMEMTR